MDKVNIHQAQTHFSRLLEQVAEGGEVVIAKAGKPVARLVPYTTTRRARRPGMMRGKIRIKADFDAPLPKSLLDRFDDSK